MYMTLGIYGWTPGKLGWDSFLLDWKAITQSPSPVGYPGGEDFVFEWKRLVEHYSRHNLSNPEDKLLALSAVARKISNESGNEYVAGIWKHAIPPLLLWRAIETAKRQRRYIAPSWSWASLEGRIEYRHFRDSGIRAKVMGVSLKTSDGDMFTSIKSRYLHICGLVRRVSVLPQGRKPHENRECLSIRDNNVGSEVLVSGYADVSMSDLFQNVLGVNALLLLIEHDEGLILEELGRDTFRRLGSFSSIDASQFTS